MYSPGGLIISQSYKVNNLVDQRGRSIRGTKEEGVMYSPRGIILSLSYKVVKLVHQRDRSAKSPKGRAMYSPGVITL